MSSLSDKLKSLGVRLGAQDLPPPRKRPGFPIEQVVDGRFLETPFGQAFVVESRYSPDHRHGQVGIELNASLRTIAAWSKEPRLQDFDPRQLVFLDTETSGLMGGTGTYAFLIGVGRLDAAGFHLAQYFMRDPLEEPAQLAALNNFLGACEGLVTFNGKAFDVPILNARFITNGEVSPFRFSAHLDLLPLARRLWRDRLSSRALGSLEQHILSVSRTQEDVPGWMIPQLYFDYLKSGDARPLKSVFYHNAMDVVSMAALLNHVASLLEDPYNCPAEHGVDLIAIAKLFEDLGQTEAAANLYARGLDCDLPEASRNEAVQRWSFLEKRRENLPAAADLWRQAAMRKEIYAHVELAKFYEHRQRDYPEAIHWTHAAIALVKTPDFPLLERNQCLHELEHRLERLHKKNQLRDANELEG